MMRCRLDIGGGQSLYAHTDAPFTSRDTIASPAQTQNLSCTFIAVSIKWNAPDTYYKCTDDHYDGYHDDR